MSSVTQILPRASIVMRLRGSSKVVLGKCLVIRPSDLTTPSIVLPLLRGRRPFPYGINNIIRYKDKRYTIGVAGGLVRWRMN